MSALMVFVLALASGAASPATIYRCPGSNGEALFSDRPCVGGGPQSVQPVMTVDMPDFSAEEEATLRRLDSAPIAPTAAQRQRTHAKSQDQRRCEAARDGLERVRAKKRSGYSASSAAALDAREREYEHRRDRDCGR